MTRQNLPEVLNIGLRMCIFTDWQKKNIPKCPTPCRDNEIAYVFSDYEVIICTQTLIFTHKHTSYIDNTREVINWLNGIETKYFNMGSILGRF
jgi:hypothetical protein